jgi:hypothetical protein
LSAAITNSGPAATLEKIKEEMILNSSGGLGFLLAEQFDIEAVGVRVTPVAVTGLFVTRIFSRCGCRIQQNATSFVLAPEKNCGWSAQERASVVETVRTA